jgi:hypothetical protein
MTRFFGLLGFVAFGILGCGRYPLSANGTGLSQSLRQCGEEDIVMAGNTRDSILYAEGPLVIWLRRIVWEDSVARIPHGKSDGAIYVFSNAALLAAIPVFSTTPPFDPRIQALPGRKVALICYEYGDPNGVPVNRFQYVAKVYEISPKGCSLWDSIPLEPLVQIDSNTRVVRTCEVLAGVDENVRAAVLSWSTSAGPRGDLTSVTLQDTRTLSAPRAAGR